jgi:hypothetical protein
MSTKKANRVLLLAVLGFTLSLSAKEIPRTEYIKYLPITYPRIVSQTEMNNVFSLYGDKNDPAYQDIAPIDGIDDRRSKVLEKLAVRFAPYLVQNTTDAPMDFKYYVNDPDRFPLYVDTWNLSIDKPQLVQSSVVNFISDDSQLLLLIREFHPDRSSDNSIWSAKKHPGEEFFKVLYFDFPGQDEKSWEEKCAIEISRPQNKSGAGFIKTYVHMFITDECSRAGNASGYEFVIQYWFFYPRNDGGNNHEGDWEHINVIISPIGKVKECLSVDEIDRILETTGSKIRADKDRLVIKRLEYYFHYKVMAVDFSTPNAYAPRNDWKQEIEALDKDRRGKLWIWEKIRSMAYKDAEEKEINTHPFGYIGGDCRGYEQILSTPGGKNRNSHGNYPFPGIYREVGPGNSSEKISARFDHLAYYNNGAPKKKESEKAFGRGTVIPFDDPQKIEIVPDWERVIDPVLSSREARKKWFWLVLPIRFGYPASSSPFAGVVAHANTGNLSTLGPAFSDAWNRIGGTSEFDVYIPHKLSKAFPLDWQDGFSNGLGFFNLIIPTLENIPPFSLFSRVLKIPFNGFNSRKTVFYPKEIVPFRHVGISFGMFQQKIPGFLSTLSYSPEQTDEIQSKISSLDPGYENDRINRNYITEKMKGMMFQLNFHLGTRLISENTLRYSSATMGENIESRGYPESFQIRNEFNMWEYIGSIRYNLKAGNIQPYVKIGYGWTWFRAQNIFVGGQPLEKSESFWVGKPSITKLENLLPNSWHYGFGIEILPIKTLNGLDVGLKLEYLKNHSHFKLDMELSPWSGVTQGTVKIQPGNLSLSLTIAY